MNSTKQPNTAELLMKPVRISPGWREQAELTIKNMTAVQLPQLWVREEAPVSHDATTHCTSTREVLLRL